jgi:Asp-tRNA(Asn)/Glu-tRNA(Gln) amidotransferase C subunit
VIKTEKFNNLCSRNEMEIQSKTLDALLEKAEQVIRLLEVNDDTKCEPSHESEAVDQLRADNDGRGNSPKEELRAYLRYAVTKISTE